LEPSSWNFDLSLDEYGLASLGENPSFDLLEWAMTASSSPSSYKRHLGELAFGSLQGFYCKAFGSDPGWWLDV
jgi:hypothetical protein